MELLGPMPVAHMKGFDALSGLPGSPSAVNSYKLTSPKRYEKASVVAEAKAAVGALLHVLLITAFHNKPAPIGVEDAVDFHLADWLLKAMRPSTSRSRRFFNRNMLFMVRTDVGQKMKSAICADCAAS
jgi:hypothetical protein